MKAAEKAGFTEAQLETALRWVVDRAELTIGFNPDQKLELCTLAPEGGAFKTAVPRDRSLVDAFLVDERYRSQFETGVTMAGDPTAYADGLRDYAEHRLFHDAYHDHPLVPEERPVYGLLNVGGFADGGSNRYGDCYFVLKPGVKERATFTGVDSLNGASAVTTVENLTRIVPDMVKCFSGQRFSGQPPLFARMTTPAIEDKSSGRFHPNTEYVEAQIHGPVELDKDLDRIVANVWYLGTPYEAKLRRLAKRYGAPLRWHDGAREVSNQDAAQLAQDRQLTCNSVGFRRLHEKFDEALLQELRKDSRHQPRGGARDGADSGGPRRGGAQRSPAWRARGALG